MPDGVPLLLAIAFIVGLKVQAKVANSGCDINLKQSKSKISDERAVVGLALNSQAISRHDESESRTVKLIEVVPEFFFTDVGVAFINV